MQREPETSTTEEQGELERSVAELYAPLWKFIRSHPDDKGFVTLSRPQHEAFLWGALGDLPGAADARCTFACDASHPPAGCNGDCCVSGHLTHAAVRLI
jgi:hypothetical protein